MKVIILAAAVLTAGSLYAKEPESFCTLETATDHFMSAAGISTSRISNKHAAQGIELYARDLVLKKMADKPGENIRITWADVYRLRGVANQMLCRMDSGILSYVNCAGAVLDAVGEGIHGTTTGSYMYTALMIGPNGYLLAGFKASMKIAEETFQCDPSAVRMLAHSGAEFSLVVPICKGPVNKACVALQGGLDKAAGAALQRMFGENIARSVKVSAVEFYSGQGGQNAVKVLLAPIKSEAKSRAADAAERADKLLRSSGGNSNGTVIQGLGDVYVPEIMPMPVGGD